MASGIIKTMSASSQTRKIGFIGYPQILALDLIGPLEVFATANQLLEARSTDRPRPAYDLVVLGLSERAFTSESGVAFLPHIALTEAPALDTLLVPGGSGLREPGPLRTISQWLRQHHRSIRRIASVCTGIYALAEAGLLDDRTATTHWRYAEAFKTRYGRVKIDADAIYIKQGKLYTSAGITAGIDLALALVEEDHGPRLALAVARELVVYLKREGGQSQFSERLSFQAGTIGQLADLCAWMIEHLADDLTVERLAERCQVGPRQLGRRFKRALGMPPAAYVERLRTEEARHRLLAGDASVAQIAEAVGFHSTDVFRRAFERRFGITPVQFRARFSATALP